MKYTYNLYGLSLYFQYEIIKWIVAMIITYIGLKELIGEIFRISLENSSCFLLDNCSEIIEN